jgi:ankyrin repeat protein
MILLSQQGVISEDTLIALQKNIKLQPDANLNDPYSSFQKMITFFRANPLIADASIKKTHDQWAKIVSNLNEEQKQQSLESIAYGRGGKKDQPHTYEIKADFSAIGVKGIINMLNVLAKLIPDQQLNEKWDQDEKKRYLQAAQKLTRLCELFSRNNHFVSWVNANSNDQKIKNPFPTITLIINDQPAYYWRFKPGHFQLDPIGADRDDWRSAYKARRNFGNDWMASLFSRLHYRDSDAGFPKEQLPPLDLVYHREIKSINGAIEAITMVLDQKMDQFYPLIGRWIQKSIPLNDQYSLVKVSTLLYGWKENEAIKELLKKPSFIRIKKLVEENIERNQGNAFLLAAKFGYPQSILKLLEEDPFLIDVTDHENKRTALHYAVAQGHKAAANLLIEKKPQIINAKDNDGLTAVHLAIENGNTKLLALLISKRASIQERDNSDFLPIHHAAGHGREQAITLLINAGASVTEKSEGGMTPLHHAVAYGRTNVIDLLLKYGAKVEEKTDDGLAPLHIAASTINVAMLNLLIQKGADVNVKDNKNKTPLHHLTAGIGSVVERDTALAIAKLLIHYGVEVNAQDKKGQTPLHLAVSYGLENRDVIELLLNNGAQITIKDKKSQTPLDLALQDQDSALIDLLKKFTPKAP